MRVDRLKIVNKSHIMHQTLISKDVEKVKLDSPEQIQAMGHFLGATILLGHWLNTINTESWSRWSPDSADNFEFSAEGLSENAKTISLSP